MKAKDLRELPWIEVKDWSKITKSAIRKKWGKKELHCYIDENDVDCFVKNIYKEFSRQLNIPYKELEKVMRIENEAFYSLKDAIFRSYVYDETEPTFVSLTKTFKVPYIGDSRVEKCKILFEQLSPTEKMDFLLEAFDLVGKLIVAQAGEINKAMEEEDSP